ncbi:MAG: glycosyltransferase [Candidatus Omnitrophica bacterium]|nr:glycosyltransferase [Candidatus Omnitrophota bacterium]
MVQTAQASIIVPCYNEAERFPKEKFVSFTRTNQDYFFLFVDDGSTDETPAILESLKRTNPDRFGVLRLEKNFGKGEAVRRGFLQAMKAKPTYLGFWDADLATPLEVIPSFLTVLKGRPSVEMVFGSRIKLMGSDIQRNELRHYVGRIFATAASFVLKLAIYDTQCGAKMFRNTDVLHTIFTEPFRSRWIFDVELIARFLRLKRTQGFQNGNSSIYELPLPSWHDIKGSKLHTTDFVKALWDLLQIYLTYR